MARATVADDGEDQIGVRIHLQHRGKDQNTAMASDD
jgi:hypothetical protein